MTPASPLTARSVRLTAKHQTGTNTEPMNNASLSAIQKRILLVDEEMFTSNLVIQEKVVCNSTAFWLMLHSCTTLSWEHVASRLCSLLQEQLAT